MTAADSLAARNPFTRCGLIPEVTRHQGVTETGWRLKVSDQQNRLGFVVALAKQVASDQRDRDAAAKLAAVEARLERARLVGEDTLCRETMTDAERRWLASDRSAGRCRRDGSASGVLARYISWIRSQGQLLPGSARWSECEN